MSVQSENIGFISKLPCVVLTAKYGIKLKIENMVIGILGADGTGKSTLLAS